MVYFISDRKSPGLLHLPGPCNLTGTDPFYGLPKGWRALLPLFGQNVQSYHWPQTIRFLTEKVQWSPSKNTGSYRTKDWRWVGKRISWVPDYYQIQAWNKRWNSDSIQAWKASFQDFHEQNQNWRPLLRWKIPEKPARKKCIKLKGVHWSHQLRGKILPWKSTGNTCWNKAPYRTHRAQKTDFDFRWKTALGVRNSREDDQGKLSWYFWSKNQR